MWFVGLAIIELVGLFGLRASYRIQAPRGIDRDAYAHMLFAEDIRNNGFRLPDRPSSVVTSGGYGYPFFMHYLLAFVPTRYYRIVDRFFSPIIDVGFGIMLLSLVPAGILSEWQGLAVLGIFALSPQFMRPDLPNAIGLSARKPGLLITVIGLLVTTAWLSTGQLWLLAITVLLAAATFLTSKFSAQALLFVILGFSITGYPIALVVFGAGVIVAIVASGGAYAVVFKSHIEFLYEYATVKQQKLFEPVRLDVLTMLREIDSLKSLFVTAYHNRIVRPLANNQYFIGVLVTYAYGLAVGEIPALPFGFHIWIVSCVAAFVLTSLPQFMFIGKAERYLEYAFLPATVLLVRAWGEFGTVYQGTIAAVLLSGVIVILLYMISFQRFFSVPSEEADLGDVIDYLKQLDPGTIVVYPFWKARRIAWETNHNVVDFVMNEGLTPTAESDHLFPDSYGFVTDDLEWLTETYDPDYVVFDFRKKDEMAERGELQPPEVEPLFVAGDFEVYDFEAYRSNIA